MIQAHIFQIQRYSLHDGGGIRTIVFFKGCPFHCPWCSNPESLSIQPQIMNTSSLCMHCKSDDMNTCPALPEDCPTKAKRYVGETKTIDELVYVISRDQVFYETSNGGATLSGGEILLQQEAALALLKQLQLKKIHTAIETTLAVPLKYFEEWIKYTNLFLVDLKILDPQLSKQILGIDIDLVKRQITHLCQNGANVVIRMPLIPGYTTSLSNLKEVVVFMLQNQLCEIHLLPYHAYGESKYHGLNQEYPCAHITPLSDDELQVIQKYFNQHQIHAIIGGI